MLTSLTQDFLNVFYYGQKITIPYTSTITTNLLLLIMETSLDKRHSILERVQRRATKYITTQLTNPD